MNSWREFAKFACGAEAFHALLHGALFGIQLKKGRRPQKAA